MVTVLAGGVGAAKFLAGLCDEIDPAAVTAIVNIADDTLVHGLYVSPDLDSCTYTLAGANDTDRGWGLRGETWLAMEHLRMLRRGERRDLRRCRSLVQPRRPRPGHAPVPDVAGPRRQEPLAR